MSKNLYNQAKIRMIHFYTYCLFCHILALAYSTILPICPYIIIHHTLHINLYTYKLNLIPIPYTQPTPYNLYLYFYTYVFNHIPFVNI